MKFTKHMDYLMDINPWKNQIDVIYGFDFILKIEGSFIDTWFYQILNLVLE